jgi:hypothetical protein
MNLLTQNSKLKKTSKALSLEYSTSVFQHISRQAVN